MKPINPRMGTVICRSTPAWRIDYANDAAHMRLLTRLKTGTVPRTQKDKVKEDEPCMKDIPRKKRWQIYSISEGGNPLLVDSFDLREEAQRQIDRMTETYYQMPKERMLRRPRFALVDAWEQTAEGAGA